ncbi:MAG: SDR family oxidoreductase [Woeseiaceae bacterium]|nr:SDR family oxidoreductase [Woeseiaceae bacterium]
MSVAIITGASSGIGAATAIAFAEAGWDVMAAGRDEGRLEEVADVSDNIATWSGEFASSDDCDELVADTIDEFGHIDCLVNSAGVIVRANVADTSNEDWRLMMTINLDAPFYLCRAALPHLLRARGSIVNIASDWGLKGGLRAAAYCASKGGIIQLTKAMALDYASYGLRVNAVCPGDVDTPMLMTEAENEEVEIEDYLADAAEQSPNGRIGTPEEVAALVLFLASDAALHITGTAIPIDGGASA